MYLQDMVSQTMRLFAACSRPPYADWVLHGRHRETVVTNKVAYSYGLLPQPQGDDCGVKRNVARV